MGRLAKNWWEKKSPILQPPAPASAALPRPRPRVGRRTRTAPAPRLRRARGGARRDGRPAEARGARGAGVSLGCGLAGVGGIRAAGLPSVGLANGRNLLALGL